ncbi:MAG: hypothetical protein FJW77_03550 [Actinobacteria bacterium]|nr:hypothetical protein [Actinomycetota bacterium]
MDAAERALLDASVQTAVADAVARDVPVDPVLARLGWPAMLSDEPEAAVAAVFGALGRTGARSGALDDLCAHALGFAPRPDLAVVLPAFGGWAPPGTVTAGTVRVAGLGTARAATATDLLVATDAGPVVVPVGAGTVTPIGGVDPAGGFHAVRAEWPGVTPTPDDGRAWAAAVALGQRAVGHEVAGAARTVVDQARDHARTRIQFGRPIAAFQAVRHHLADAFVAVEGLEAALDAAAVAGTPVTAALAKAAAGRAARSVVDHCRQVLGGIGFTTDHPFHRHWTRLLVLEGLLGTPEALLTDLGRGWIAAGGVPTLVDL